MAEPHGMAHQASVRVRQTLRSPGAVGFSKHGPGGFARLRQLRERTAHALLPLGERMVEAIIVSTLPCPPAAGLMSVGCYAAVGRSSSRALGRSVDAKRWRGEVANFARLLNAKIPVRKLTALERNPEIHRFIRLQFAGEDQAAVLDFIRGNTSCPLSARSERHTSRRGGQGKGQRLQNCGCRWDFSVSR